MLYLIRHGETPQNAAGIVQLPDAPLSERGLEQVQRLAERLAGAGIRAILTSDLRRAALTAEVLASALGLVPVADPLLQERNFGALRGRPYAELEVDPFAPDYEPPGGESVPVFHARVARAWERIELTASATPGPLAVVSHGFVCRALVTHHLELDPALAAAQRGRGFGNASLTVAERAPDGGRWRVRLLASAS